MLGGEFASYIINHCWGNWCLPFLCISGGNKRQEKGEGVSYFFQRNLKWLYTVYCILYTVYCILYTVYCILYTVYSILYTVYCIQYTVYCIQYTVYSLYIMHEMNPFKKSKGKRSIWKKDCVIRAKVKSQIQLNFFQKGRIKNRIFLFRTFSRIL